MQPGRRNLALLFLLGPALLIVGGAGVYLLLGAPFGRTFESLLTVAIIGLVLALLVPGVVLVSKRAWWRRTLGALLALIAVAFGGAVLAVKIDSTLLPWVDYRKDVSVAEWRADLDFLQRELPLRHPDLFSLVPEAEFNSAVDGLRARVDELDGVQMRAELARIIALPNDAHTFPNIYSFSLDWHMYPLEAHMFDDGFYITDAGREYRDAIGTKLTAVCGRPLDEVFDAVRPFLSAENEYGVLDRNCGTIFLAEWLYAAGIADRIDRASFTFTGDDAHSFSLDIDSEHYLPVLYWQLFRTVDNDVPWIDGRTRRNNYRFEYRADSGTLWFQFNTFEDQPDIESLDDFLARLGAWVEANDFERFVIDLRANDGGNGQLSRRVVDFCAADEKIDRDGRFFVITSRRTFSAGVILATMLQNNTKVTVVGEPTSQGPVFHSNPEVMQLPDSHCAFLVSSRPTPAGLPGDSRDRIEVDIPTEYTWADYRAGRDPAFEAILACEAPPPAVAAEVASELLVECVGRYRFGPLAAIDVTRDGDGLAFRLDDFIEASWRTASSQLHARGDHRFETDIAGVDLRFHRSGDRISGVTFTWPDSSVFAPRAPEGWRAPFECLVDGDVTGTLAVLENEADRVRDYVPRFEAFLNFYGYERLRAGEGENAREIFALNSRLFAESANVWDSYGEACLAVGDTSSAIASYEKALELNPDFANPREVLAQLR